MAANDRAGSPIEYIHPKRFEIIIDLNLEHPRRPRGGAAVGRRQHRARQDAKPSVRDAGQDIHCEKDNPNSQYLFARLEARAIQQARRAGHRRRDARRRRRGCARRRTIRRSSGRSTARKCRAIFHIWPDFEVSACINKSIATVKADAAQNSFSASRRGHHVGGDGLRHQARSPAFHASTATSIRRRRCTRISPSTAAVRSTTRTATARTSPGSSPASGAWRRTRPRTQRPLAISRYLKKDTEDVELSGDAARGRQRHGAAVQAGEPARARRKRQGIGEQPDRGASPTSRR